MDFGLGFSDELLKTSLMVVWELMKPSWCPSPKVDLILCATQDLQRELNSDCNLPELNFIYSLMTTASMSTRENNVELLSAESLWTRISCMWRSRHLQNTCKTPAKQVKTPAKQHKQLRRLFRNIVMKAKTETELIADCHGRTEVNLVTALGFYRMFASLVSLL